MVKISGIRQQRENENHANRYPRLWLEGATLGTLFAHAGHEVVFSYSRSQQKLKRLAREAGRNARAGTPTDAARDAEALLLAVHWSQVDRVLKQAGDLSEKVIVSCSLPMNASDTELVVAHTSAPDEVWATRCGQNGRAVRRSFLRSTRYRARRWCVYSSRIASPIDRAWSTAATINERKRSRQR